MLTVIICLKLTSCFLIQLYEALADQLTDIIVNAVSFSSSFECSRLKENFKKEMLVDFVFRSNIFTVIFF